MGLKLKDLLMNHRMIHDMEDYLGRTSLKIVKENVIRNEELEERIENDCACLTKS